MSEIRPTWTAPTWATVGATYPAGVSPWSGAPTRHTPALDYWTPGEPLAARDLNGIVGRATDALTAGRAQSLALADWIVTSDASSWKAPVAVAGGLKAAALTWGTTNNAWYRMQNVVVGGVQVHQSRDGGTSWTALASISGHATGAAYALVEFAGALYCSFAGDGSSLSAKLQKFSYGAGTWGADIAWGATPAVVQSQLFLLGGKICVAGLDTSTSVLIVGASIDGTFSPLLGSTAASAPAAFANLRAASSGTMAIIIPTAVPAPSATRTYYLVTAAGSTMTAQTGGWAAGARVQSAAWSAREACFIVAVLASGGASMQFWRSTDGVTWAQVGTFATSTGLASAPGLANVEHAWVVAGIDSGGFDRAAVSLDGCATWRYVPLQSPAAGTLGAVTGITAELVTSPQQWALRCEGGTALTGARGFDGPALP